MNENSNHTESWAPCTPGTLQTFGRHAKVQRRLHGAARATGIAVVLLCVTGLTVWSVGRFTGEREHYFGGIACHEVRANLEAYAMGTLSDELAKRIETHLRECPACQEFMKQMNQQASTDTTHVVNCSCPHCRALISHASETQPGRLASAHFTKRVQLLLAQS